MGLPARAMHAWKSIPGSTDSPRKKPEAEKAVVYSSYSGLKEQRSRRRAIYHSLTVAMSFKRDGDDWSQLNVLKVSPSESLITFSRPVALFCCSGDI